MATLAALKKKIAALEAQVEQVTKAEMGTAIAKVRKIMSDFGLTVAHLTDGVTAPKAAKKRGTAAKPGGKAKGSKAAKYQDPATGVTWSGVGRAPAWIASAKDRTTFLINKAHAAAASAESPTTAKKSVKRAAKTATAKVADVAKRATAAKKAPRKVAAKKAAAKKTTPVKVAKKTASKPAASKKVAGKATRKRAAATTPATVPAPVEAASA